MNRQTSCTDYTTLLDVSSGEFYKTYIIPLDNAFSVAFVSEAWFADPAVGADSN